MHSDLGFSVRGLGCEVGGGFALRDVSFELPTGYVMGLIGANGAGKTTTIRCLLGMRGFETGEIELLGHRVPGPVALRQDVGVVLDRTYVVGDWRWPRSNGRCVPSTTAGTARVTGSCSPSSDWIYGPRSRTCPAAWR